MQEIILHRTSRQFAPEHQETEIRIVVQHSQDDVSITASVTVIEWILTSYILRGLQPQQHVSVET
jgi:hypothetical protein